jgi:hypothetical protein
MVTRRPSKFIGERRVQSRTGRDRADPRRLKVIREALQAPEGTPVCSITPVSRAPSQPEQCLCASLSWRAA